MAEIAVGNQHGALMPFGRRKSFTTGGDTWIPSTIMSAVMRSSLRTSPRIPGIAMIERTHGIEGMRGMASAGLHGLRGNGHFRIGVTDADANFPPRRLRNYFDGAGNFRRNRHHAHMPARGLPKIVEDLNRGRDQILRRMHSAALVAEKGALEMNAQWPSLRSGVLVRLLRRFNRIRETSQRGEGAVERGCNRGGEISGHAVSSQELTQARELGSRGAHDVEAGAPMHVNIEKSRGQDSIAEIHQRDFAGNFFAGAGGDFEDASVFNDEQWICNLFDWSEEASCGECDFHFS